MKIVIYSSNTNAYEADSLRIFTFPSWKTQWQKICALHPENEYVFVSQKPAFFMPEDCEILAPEVSVQDFADYILSKKPDMAVACSFWVTPFDWLSVKDALIAEKLRENEIETVCHPLKSMLICFDKWQTHLFLSANGFNVAKAVYVHHDLYFCAGSVKGVLENPYKESVFAQIKKLNLPLVIKDTHGLSSYGMTVVNTYGEAFCYLNSKRNNSDRIVEEFISGEQFGAEIRSYKGVHTVFPPFKFSVNQYGITSPKQSIKTGPVTDELYDIFGLESELKRLAGLLELDGPSQVDLVFDGKKWFIIEINPRLSGMSETYAASSDFLFKNFLPVVNEKLPLMSKAELEKLCTRSDVKYVCQIEDLTARQEREKGYCEVVRVTGL